MPAKPRIIVITAIEQAADGTKTVRTADTHYALAGTIANDDVDMDFLLTACKRRKPVAVILAEDGHRIRAVRPAYLDRVISIQPTKIKDELQVMLERRPAPVFLCLTDPYATEIRKLLEHSMAEKINLLLVVHPKTMRLEEVQLAH